MVTFYKHHIPDWMDGTEDLDDGPYRAYHVVCQLIYLNEGPITLHEKGIAGRCHQHVLAFRKNLRVLIDAGKLQLIDGRLHNNRAATELESVVDHRATSARGGRGSAGVAKGSARGSAEVRDRFDAGPPNNTLKNNDQATVPLFDQQQHKTREEKTREEKTRKECSDLSESAPDGAGIQETRVLGNYDFVSDDGSVLILADEFEQLQAELPSIKNIRGVVRHACRTWLDTFEPSERKDGLLRWLRKKHAENGQRQSSVKREDAKEAARRAVEADIERRKQADKALAVRERLAQERQQRREANHAQAGPGGELAPPHPHGSH
ncbi:YdaU family protein [Bradyrhizobium sp. CCGUVB1N3]|uniref:DUF1376 domain-containing protein n=1 Tax=Bradyrhizobium sp. CCGUVB1N3 TaxID=2949629 RepID=UPI0020B44E4A|nr:DUF1376 domain-containing protein [Bradyrhizobium sp. CCGUVB1N3]MCP3475092.1 YdaU family protein [Bradyrhizobium sp. CCGUVB1N3]